MNTLHVPRFVPFRGETLPRLELGDVVRTPSGREAMFLQMVSGRMLLRYIDDGSEVPLLPKLLTFVRRADGSLA